MPANIPNLLNALKQMKNVYLNDPTVAVRGQGFINILHDYCIDELINIGVPKEKIFKEATIYGSHKAKDVDVAVIDKLNGPFIIVGIRSQMSSVSKNILTYYEEIIGDCISLHDRFPMAVICYVYLLPTRPIKPGLEKESIDLERAEKLFRLITDRGDWRNTKDKYEHFAFLKVDFTEENPNLLDTLPQLRINDFFDKIKETYNERNLFNQF
ncbi:MAG: hypothetical protein KF758_03780 [Anaerolineales bacterium]|nr:hypothetical protein [Anaerolineales bacterium]